MSVLLQGWTHSSEVMFCVVCHVLSIYISTCFVLCTLQEGSKWHGGRNSLTCALDFAWGLYICHRRENRIFTSCSLHSMNRWLWLL